MDRLGLNYGGIDVIVTPDDDYVFLEVNPGGEFHWLDHTTGLPIAKALADVLLNRVPRRLSPEQHASVQSSTQA
jgi:glutathione synthase/RimK-type ligase-like ATP-grasp enzyme